MTKRLIDIDDRLLETAQMALGAATYKETVARALEQVVAARQRAREEIAHLLQSFSEATADLGNHEIMDSAWR